MNATALEWIALVITTVGFSVTIWQLVRTANASEASVKAIKRTERRMALNHLLVLLPQFQIVESDLDHAIAIDNREWAVRALVNCKNVASEVAAMLEGQDSVEPEVVQTLQVLSQDATDAKSSLITEPNLTITQVTHELRHSLSGLAAQMGAIAGKFKLQVGT